MKHRCRKAFGAGGLFRKSVAEKNCHVSLVFLQCHGAAESHLSLHLPSQCPPGVSMTKIYDFI